jgi:hypothetical protein
MGRIVGLCVRNARDHVFRTCGSGGGSAGRPVFARRGPAVLPRPHQLERSADQRARGSACDGGAATWAEPGVHRSDARAPRRGDPSARRAPRTARLSRCTPTSDCRTYSAPSTRPPEPFARVRTPVTLSRSRWPASRSRTHRPHDVSRRHRCVGGVGSLAWGKLIK